MKKNVFFRQRLLSAAEVLLLAAMMSAPFGLSAQVTIGSGNLPQATLDIIGDTLTAHGEAFRMIDGNQAPGKVLTCDENGIGSWQKGGLTILYATLDRQRTAPTFTFSDYSSSTYVDYGIYVDLEPGRYLIICLLPIYFDFSLNAFENVSYQMGLTKDGSSMQGNSTQAIKGPLRANVMTRDLSICTIDTSGDSSTTRYFVYYSQFHHINATGGTINQTGTVRLFGNGMGGNLMAIPLLQ